MNRKKLIILVCCLILINSLSAQLCFNFKLGEGAYIMDGLKEFNSKIITSLPVRARIVDDFPKTSFWEGNFLYGYNRWYVGISVSHNTTGSRISYGDYSGSLKYDQIVSSTSFGPIVKLKLNLKSKLRFYPYLSANIINTNYRFDEEVIISNQKQNKSTKLASAGVLLNFGIETVYSFNWVGFGLFVGYSKCADAKLYMDDKEASFGDGEKIYTNWTGVRYGLSIFFELDLKNRPKTNKLV